jgi:hypothetical protein
MLSNSDQIDLRDINFSTMHSSFDQSTGVLDVSDGTTAAHLKFIGDYSQANFKFLDDGNAGTILYAQAASQAANGASAIAATAGQDSFVFAPNFGQVTITSFAPATDVIQFSKSIFPDIATLLSATHDDLHGDAVITDAALDVVTLRGVSTAELLAHQNAFHFI